MKNWRFLVREQRGTLIAVALFVVMFTIYVTNHPDVSAQAQRLAAALKEAEVPVALYGGKETTHVKINADLGLPDDPGTKALFDFVDKALAK